MSNVKTLHRAGRAPGQTNLATRARQALASAAVAVIAGKMTDAEVEGMMPLAVLLGAMRAAWLAGDIAGARVAAEAAAPYCHSRKGPKAMSELIPDDLTPDPEPEPDEEGPPGGCIM
jgi:hypothetical protein